MLIKDPANTFFFRVYGDSTESAGIFDRYIRPQPGEVVVASLDGEFTVKRLGVDRYGQGWLLPENPKYPVIPVPPESEFSIFGVVTYCLHKPI